MTHLVASMVEEVVGAESIAELWRAFGEAITPARLRLSYGAYWPRQPVAVERVWTFRAAPALNIVAAWGALRPDPVDPIAWLMLGVWPAHQGKGWADYLRQWLVQTAAAEFRVEYVGVEILRNNAEHLDRWLHRTPPGWRRIGEIEIPPPGGVFFACSVDRLTASEPRTRR